MYKSLWSLPKRQKDYIKVKKAGETWGPLIEHIPSGSKSASSLLSNTSMTGIPGKLEVEGIFLNLIKGIIKT